MYIKNNKKWFTLVELIVVIVILVILSSLWFYSYTWYLVWARDWQRVSDINTISSSIEDVSIKWLSNLSVLVDITKIDKTWIWNFYYWWRNLTWIDWYKAWWINFNYLIDISKELYDPKTLNSYVIWVYNNVYELASTLEDTNTSYILRSTKKRTSQWTISSLSWTIDTANNYITLLNREDSFKYRSWDLIWTWSTWYSQIIDIVWERIYLDDVSWFSVIDSISLLNDDTSLIWNAQNWDWTSNDCIVTTNVWENKCPIEELNKWLIPYKIY